MAQLLDFFGLMGGFRIVSSDRNKLLFPSNKPIQICELLPWVWLWIKYFVKIIELERDAKVLNSVNSVLSTHHLFEKQ